jgi:hypothetical protein
VLSANPDKEPLVDGKIFGIGLPKTGLTSLTSALNLLGYRASQYQFGVMDWDTLNQVQNGVFRLKVLERYDAITDLPFISRFPHAFDQEYPGSKFILTVREIDSWLRSAENWFTSKPISTQHQDNKVTSYKTTPFFDLYFRVLLFGSVRFSQDHLRYVYAEHYDRVTRYFADREKDLLILNTAAGEGWEQLCSFLGKAIPDVPYPHENQSRYQS